MRKVFFAILLEFFNSLLLFSQNDPQSTLQKVIPMSPTAVSLAKYGDIPVNYYSGAPSISIPLFNINSGNLELPVSLSYQFNGLKTEEIASWVGLGWALNAGGSISRAIRGTADEDMNGYMNGSSMNIQYMINHPSDPDVIQNLKLAGKGQYDTEPDIFFFNFLSYSGKFYYSQEEQKFYTLPKENLSISYNSIAHSFTIITPDGNKFIFDKREITTTTGASCNGSTPPVNSYVSVTSSWYLSAIKNSDETEIITFEYTDGIYSFAHLSSESKYFLTGYAGSHASSPPNFNDEICTQSSQIDVKRLSYIYFRNGYLKFTLTGGDRCDLPGDKSLQKIELFDNANVLIKRYVLNYSYFGDISSPYACNYPNYLSLRLKLLSIQEEGSSGLIQINPYSFEYEENGGFPSRLSYSQDYWGYNNNVSTNQTLIPPTVYNSPNGPFYFPGANRRPSFDGAKLGSIKKVTYPTKGSTEFVFENNEINDPVIEPNLQWSIEALEGDHIGTQTYYEKTFTINEQPNQFNGFNYGALVEVGVTEPGCDITGGTACAILALEGLTPGTSGWGYLTTYHMNGFYLPNGTYRMTATFNQVPPMFQDFYYYIKWAHAIYDSSYLVGGIRIKEIRDYDGIDHSKDVVKKYSYAADQDGLSSGVVYSYPYDHTTTFSNEYYSQDASCIWLSLYRTFLRISSASNYPLVSAGGGGYVGYGQVTESLGNNGENGKNVFYYKSYPDLLSTSFPFTATSREWRRGFLLENRRYKQGTILKTKEQKAYDEFSEYDPQISKVSLGLKVGFNLSVSNATPACGSNIPIWISQRIGEAENPLYDEYETIAGSSIVSTSTSTSYEEGNQLQLTSEFTYNNKNFLPITSKLITSNGENVTTKQKYNPDYVLYNTSPTWLYQLQQRKISSFPVEKIKILKKADNSQYVVGGSITVYRDDKPLIDRIYTLETNSPIPLGSFIESYVDGAGNFIKDSRYKEAIVFNQYDQYYNLQSQQKSNDVITSYIWGYNQEYPVAQIIGKSYNDAISQSGINLSVINNPSTDESTMRTELNKLRLLSGVLVTTYTYKPLKGMSSETDPRGRIIYYEYDELNRLSLVRDNENNIIKRVCYNYAGLPENCASNCTNTSPSWQNTTTPLRCQQGACGNTGYQEQEQIDVNTCSATYNQTQWVVSGYNPSICVPSTTTPNWQNTSTPPVCQQNSCGNTGYQLQEQIDINPCSATYNQLQTVQIYNPTACPPSSNPVIDYQNSVSASGFTATYTNNSTGQVYSFSIPSSGTGTLGCIPAATYTLTISKPGNNMLVLFGTGCQYSTGTSATFGKVAVSTSSCHTVSLEGAY